MASGSTAGSRRHRRQSHSHVRLCSSGSSASSSAASERSGVRRRRGSSPAQTLSGIFEQLKNAASRHRILKSAPSVTAVSTVTVGCDSTSNKRRAVSAASAGLPGRGSWDASSP